MNTVNGRELLSLLELEQYGSVLFGLLNIRVKFATLAAYLSLGLGLLVYPIIIFFLPPSKRSPAMTGILLTRMLNTNSTNQSK